MTSPELSLPDGSTIGDLAHSKSEKKLADYTKHGPLFQITLNDQLTPAQEFSTLAHELGHIFCGHLGGCQGQSVKDDNQSGWPDRQQLGTAEGEVEAEAVAFLVASRAGIVTRSAQYLKPHVERVDMGRIDPDLVVRAAARIERMAGLRYGTMTFK